MTVHYVRNGRWAVGRYAVTFTPQPWSFGLSLSWDRDEDGITVCGLIGPVHYLVSPAWASDRAAV